MAFKPADTLLNRTYLGLILAQFLAAFNDQAIHASSMFFAIHNHTLTKRLAISLMPILFYAPWAIFCTVAGYLADRYSKRNSLVFWKIAEIGITLVALLGFWLGSAHEMTVLGPSIVLSTVFLMGTHSAFFVPAKYGVMPEILEPQLLSKGNGILESTSFLAVILGTVAGGILSDKRVFQGREYYIGLILVALAVIGALASLLIRRMPAANPTRPFPVNPVKPLGDNLLVMLRSRPLALAVLGIAFFTFMVAFMRSTVYMHGETRVPRWSELHTSMVVATVALGVGLGSPLAGFLSGGKIELGLVPLGAVGMIIASAVAGLVIGASTSLIAALVCIGFFSGFYIVPLYTLLQHRAPKTSKGDLIATSNFINVTGAIIASLLFYSVAFLASWLKVPEEQLPPYLFLGASGMTLAILILLCRQLPDFFVRALLWLRSHGRYRLRVVGVNNLPSNGPVILATNCDRFQDCMQVIAATDRFTRFVLLESAADAPPRPFLRFLARRTGLEVLRHGRIDEPAIDKALSKGGRALDVGDMLGVTVESEELAQEAEQFFQRLTSRHAVTILPVYCETGRSGPGHTEHGLIFTLRRVRVIIGRPLEPGTPIDQVRRAIRELGDWLQTADHSGEPPATVRIPGPSTAMPAAEPRPG